MMIGPRTDHAEGLSAVQAIALGILGVVAAVLTLSADIAANFWSPNLQVAFWSRLAEHGPSRLWWASLGNLFTMPLHFFGLLILFQALRPAGLFWSAGPVLAMAAALFTYAQFIHSAWWFLGTIADAQTPSTVPVLTPLLGALEAQARLELSHFRWATLVPVVWMVIPILRGRTLFPRWVAALPFILFPTVVATAATLILGDAPPALVHGLGGPFLLGLLYAIAAWCVLRQRQPEPRLSEALSRAS